MFFMNINTVLRTLNLVTRLVEEPFVEKQTSTTTGDGRGKS